MSVPTPILQYNLSDASVKGLLPSGYTPLAYIESTTSNQYIDTGFKYSSGNITVDCEYTVPSNGNATIFGSSNDNTKWLCLIYKSGSNSLHYCGTISGGWANSELSGNKRKITYSISGTTCTLNDGKLSVSSSCGTIPAQTYSYTLWCHHYSNTFTQYAQNARIYYFRLVYQGNLTLDYRPARRDSDGVIGMYDLVSKTFKTNSGSGTFIAGPELAVGKGGGRSLPEEYLLVEYLQMAPGLYINTGQAVAANDVTKTEAWMWYASGSTRDLMGWSTAAAEYWGCTAGSAWEKVTGVSPITQRQKVTYNYTATTAGTYQIGALTGGYSTRTKYIEQVKITIGGALKRNLYACYRKSDMKPGMYDTVTGTFCTNLGSGEFILGPSITNCYTSELNAGSGTLLGFYTNLSGIYNSSKGWVADFTGNGFMEALSYQPSSTFSIACWVKTSTTNTLKRIFWNGPASTAWVSFRWGIIIQTSGNTPIFTISDGSTATLYSCAGTTNVCNGIWHHLVGTYNSGTMKLYVDGNLEKTYTTNISPVANTATRISGSSAGERHTGLIYNCMLFDVCLTDALVKELYGK